ncbi:MAG: hypothetical protein KC620_22985, partial [Myxococcales bacterium]|nr:hypothetical protein [Myxococcales bacterium]
VEPEVARVPSHLPAPAAFTWKEQRFIGEGRSALDDSVPRYRLILGDLHEVPAHVHQVLASDGFVGRLAFDADEDYSAYVDKVLRWEKAPSAARQPAARLYTVRDGTAATTAGAEHLMGALNDSLQDKWAMGTVPLSSLESHGERAPDRDAFVRVARQVEAGIVFSLSHGLGAPDDGWQDADRMYRLQGAMSFGDDGWLEGRDVAKGAFAPGSLWFMFACFGAGTPGESAYHQWLKLLAEEGESDAREVAAVLESLPKRVGGRPFIARLPKQALANPDGPLGFVGHIDLAWTYSFQRLDQKVRARPGKFTDLVKHAARTDRFGIAFDALYHGLVDVDSQLNEVQRVIERGEQPRLSRADRGHLWMLRQDLMGYVLLGDPAARLPLANTAEAPRPVASEPIGDPTEVEGLEDIEHAIIDALRNPSKMEQTAEMYELAASDLKRWAEAYRAAGRRALAGLLRGR